MYNVIIVEDDPMVAAIDRQYVETDRAFRVAGMFKNGQQALEWLENGRADLVILDYYTPAVNGVEFVDRMHAAGHSPSIIMVTSASDTHIVRNMLSRGVLDYLIKPFEYARFQQAMEKFVQSRQMLEGHGDNLSQAAIDRLVQAQSAQSEQARLSKGLNEATLKLIRGFLMENREHTWSSEQIAEAVGLSRITVRRYMNYMVETGEILSTIDYRTGGRPSLRYQYAR